MEIRKEDMQAMKELQDLCRRHRLTIYPEGGAYSVDANDHILLAFGTSRQYRCKYFSGTTTEVKVDETIAIAAD